MYILYCISCFVYVFNLNFQVFWSEGSGHVESTIKFWCLRSSYILCFNQQKLYISYAHLPQKNMKIFAFNIYIKVNSKTYKEAGHCFFYNIFLFKAGLKKCFTFVTDSSIFIKLKTHFQLFAFIVYALTLFMR